MHRTIRVESVGWRVARAGALALVTLAVAVGPRAYGATADPGALAATLTGRMKTDLGLNDDQAGKVGSINADALGKMQALSGQQAAGQALGAILKERETALRGVLTPAQLETLQAQRAKWTAALVTQGMTMELGLTDDQARQVEAINLKSTQAMQSSLSGPRSTLPREKRVRVRTLRSAADERDDALRAVLTPDQWKIYEAKRDERRDLLKERMEQNHP